MAIGTETMDSVTEPVRANDELKEDLKDGFTDELPTVKPLPSHIETKLEQIEE